MAVVSSELFFLASPSIQMVLPPIQLLKTKVWELSFNVSFGQCAVHQQMLSWRGLLLTLPTVSPRLNSFAHVIFLFCTHINLPKELLCFNIFYFMSTVFAFIYVCAYYIPPWYPKRREEGIRLPGARVGDGCEFPEWLLGTKSSFFLFFSFLH